MILTARCADQLRPSPESVYYARRLYATHSDPRRPRLPRLLHAGRVGNARSHLAGAGPQSRPTGPDKLDTIRWVYSEIVRKIAPGEIVRMLVNSRKAEAAARRYLSRAGADASRGRVRRSPHQPRLDARQRPHLRAPRASPENLETAIVHFHFNAWAKYRIGKRTAACRRPPRRLLGKRLFDAQVDGRPFVLEGGGIDVNGRGTLITTEECYLSTRRYRCVTQAWAARNSKQLCGNIWA